MYKDSLEGPRKSKEPLRSSNILKSWIYHGPLAITFEGYDGYDMRT